MERGAFMLDGDVPRTDKEIVLDFVRARGRCNFTAIKNDLRGIGIARKKAALDEAIKTGELLRTTAGREVFFNAEEIGSGPRNSSIRFPEGSESGTHECEYDATDEN
jgi:hypothetical protein